MIIRFNLTLNFFLKKMKQGFYLSAFLGGSCWVLEPGSHVLGV